MSRGGLGTIQQLPASGRWRARLPARLGKVTVGTYDTEEEAAAALAAALRAADTTTTRTLRAWGEIWMKRRGARGLPSHENDAGIWERHVLPSAIAERELRGLQPRDIAAFARWLAERPRAVQEHGVFSRPKAGQPISKGTQRLVLGLVSGALRDAAIEGWCSSNPAAGVRPVQGQARGRERRVLSLAQQGQLLTCAAIPQATRHLYAVALYTGLRPGELWALRWGDINLGDRPCIRVQRAMKCDGKEGPPKSAKGRRTVPLLQPALDALRALGLGGADDLVFPAPSGGQRRSGDDANWGDWKRADRTSKGNRSRAGLPEGLELYSLRHTCCTALLYGWWGRRWSLVEVRAWMGHSSVAVTQIYLHDDEDGLLDAAETLRGQDAEPPQPQSGPQTPRTSRGWSVLSGGGGASDGGGGAPDRLALLRLSDPVRAGGGADQAQVQGSVAGGSAPARADHEADHAPMSRAPVLPSVEGVNLPTETRRLRQRRRSTGKVSSGPLVVQCGRHLLQLAAAGQDIPVELLTQVAATALLQLPGQAGLASRALSGEPHALRAAIELAGMLEGTAQARAGEQPTARSKGRP